MFQSYKYQEVKVIKRSPLSTYQKVLPHPIAGVVDVDEGCEIALLTVPPLDRHPNIPVAKVERKSALERSLRLKKACGPK
jgi:hypothetical protein